jgi:hypothetical protein
VLTESAFNQNKHLTAVFVDLKKAYDSVNRELLWWILKRIGVPSKIVAVIKGLHEGMRAKMRIDGKVGEWFEIVCVFRQGCVLAPLLFNIFFACVIMLADELLKEGNTDDMKAGVPITHFEEGDMWNSKKRGSFKLSSIWIALFADDTARSVDTIWAS